VWTGASRCRPIAGSAAVNAAIAARIARVTLTRARSACGGSAAESGGDGELVDEERQLLLVAAGPLGVVPGAGLLGMFYLVLPLPLCVQEPGLQSSSESSLRCIGFAVQTFSKATPAVR
jgi:hypothetical protein